VLAVESERITLEDDLTETVSELEFVVSVFANPGYKDLPNSCLDPFTHGMEPAVPAIEITDYGYPLGIRSPDREKHPSMAVNLHEMGAEFPVNLVMGALTKEMHIQLH
jgi:hypothetical protein